MPSPAADHNPRSAPLTPAAGERHTDLQAMIAEACADPKAHARVARYLGLKARPVAEPADAGPDADGNVDANASARPRSAAVELLPHLLTGGRQVLVGPPGSGKTAALKRLSHELSRAAATDPSLPMALYLDLSAARMGEGVEEMAARAMKEVGAPGHTVASAAPLVLLLDNLDRAVDVYLLEGLELFVRAGGDAGPAVVLACREADWPAYQSWFGDLPALAIEGLDEDQVSKALQERLPPETSGIAIGWIERDRRLAEVLRSPLGLEAFIEMAQADDADDWRRSRVMDALLGRILAPLPSAERTAYRTALRDVALGGMGRGSMLEVDTVAMGLGVTRDHMIRSGAVEAQGPALAFVEPLLAQHLVATALSPNARAQPAALAHRLEALEPEPKAALMVQVYDMVEDPESFLLGLLALDLEAAPEIVARCLALPRASAATGSRALVDALAQRSGEISPARLYRLGEVLAAEGMRAEARILLGASVETNDADVSSEPDQATTDEAPFARGDIDAPPPLKDWLRDFVRARNRGLALSGREVPAEAEEALRNAGDVLARIEVDLIFEHGRVAAQAGDLDRAREAFEIALSGDPDRARYLYHYGRTLISLDRASEAVEHLQRAREAAPDQADIEAALADAYRAKGWIEESLDAFAKASRLAPERVELIEAQGELHAELGQLDEAEAQLGEALRARPGQAAWHDALGQILAERGRWPGALRAFRRAHALAPQRVGYLRRLGRAHLATGDATKAVDVLQQAIELAPDAPGVLADLGLAQARAGAMNDAIESLRQAVSVDDAWPADHLQLAGLLREQSLLDEAMGHARKAVDLAPASAMARGELGRVHQASGNDREALSAFVEAAERAPENPDFREGMAGAYGALGDARGAVQAVEAAGLRESTSPAVLEQLARIHEDAGSDEDALEAMGRLLDLAPNEARYRHQAAQICLRLGREEEALAHLEAAAELAPEDLAIQRAFGEALLAAGEPERALGVLRRAARLAPQDEAIVTLLVEVARSMGRLNEARAAADEAIKRAPGRPALLALKGEVEMAMGDHGAAREAFRRAAKLDPDETSYALRLAELYEPDDSDTARRLLEEVAASAPDAEVRRRLAEMHGSSGAWKQAADEYGRARAEDRDDPRLAAAHATALRQAGQLAEARAILIQSLERHPANGALQLEMALVLEALGQDAEALAAYALAAESGVLEPSDLLRWSRLARARGEVDESIKATRLAVAARPAWSEGFAELAAAYVAGGLNEAALTAIRSAATQAPREPRHRLMQAQIARELGRYDEAIAALEEGISDNPERADLHYELGCAFEAQTWLREAKESFARAAELAPAHPTYQRALAAQLANSDPEAAIACLRRAVTAAPSDADAYYQLGGLLAGRGDDEGALVALRRAVGIEPDEPDYQIGLGRLLSAAGHVDALGVLEKCARLAPESDTAQAALGAELVQAGRLERAIELLERAVELAPEKAGHWLRLGSALLASDAPQKAREALARALDLDPDDLNARSAMELALERLGDLVDAMPEPSTNPDEHPPAFDPSEPSLGETSGVSDRVPREPRAAEDFAVEEPGAEGATDPVGSAAAGMDAAEIELLLAAAQEASSTGWMLPLALPSLSPSLALEDAALDDLMERLDALAHRSVFASGPADLALAKLAGRRGAYAAALTYAQRAADRDGEPEGLVVLGWARMLNRDPGAALEALGMAAALGQDGAELHFLTGLAEGRRGQLPQAAAAYARCAKLRPELPEPRLRLAEAALAMGQAESAREGLENALLRWPEAASVHAAMAELHRQEGEAALAIERLDRALALEPDQPEWHASLARILRDEGELEQARERLQRALQLEPGNDVYRLMDAAIAMGLNNWESAEREVEAVLAVTPNHPGALCAAGRIQLGRGDAAGALENLRRAVDVSPEDPEIQYWAGRAAWKLGEVEEAQRSLEEALRLDRESARTCLALGDLYLETGAIDDAILAYEQAILAAPDDVEPRIKLGSALTEAALMDRAVDQYQKASELAPRDPEPWLAMSKVWMATARPDRAVVAISAAIQRRPEDASLYMEAGRAYRELHELDQASEMFRRAMHLSPRSGKAYAQYAAVSARHFVEKAMPSDYENVDEEILR